MKRHKLSVAAYSIEHAKEFGPRYSFIRLRIRKILTLRKTARATHPIAESRQSIYTKVLYGARFASEGHFS